MSESAARVLTVSTRFDGNLVEISVIDTGTGIDLDIQKTLFEPFHNSTTSGMGIGLSLARSIVEAHGGRIWNEPMQGGARFVFTLNKNGKRDG
jgi:signal transduction histidine kinase